MADLAFCEEKAKEERGRLWGDVLEAQLLRGGFRRGPSRLLGLSFVGAAVDFDNRPYGLLRVEPVPL